MIDQQEYEQRYYGRFYGKRRAVVVENQDPERRGRIKVENTELYGVSKSPWCMPCYPFYGGRDCGFFSVPPIGSLVWIECEEGLPAYPIYAGGYFDMVKDGHFSDGSPIEQSSDFQKEPSTAPAHARGDYDGSDYGGLKGAYGVPATSFEGDYGEVTILRTKTGHMLEFDDTEGAERVQIHHSSGAHIEIMPDGSINLVTEGRILTRSGHREEVVINKSRETTGGSERLVEGDVTDTVSGKSTTSITGESSVSLGSLNADINGAIEVTSTVLRASMDNLFEVNAGGDISLSAFGDMDLVSAGKGLLRATNAVTVPTGICLQDSLTLQALNGNMSLFSADLAGLQKYGVSMRGGLPALTGGQVYLGNLTSLESLLGVGSVPLVKEPAILGTQMRLFMESILTALDAFFVLTSTGGITPGFGGPNPVLGTASTTAQVALTAARQTFMNPASPLITSDCVFLSKV